MTGPRRFSLIAALPLADRGVARASLRSPIRLRDGHLLIELHRADTPAVSVGSSETLLTTGRSDPDQLRDTVSFYLLRAVLGLARN